MGLYAVQVNFGVFEYINNFPDILHNEKWWTKMIFMSFYHYKNTNVKDMIRFFIYLKKKKGFIQG